MSTLLSRRAATIGVAALLVLALLVGLFLWIRPGSSEVVEANKKEDIQTAERASSPSAFNQGTDDIPARGPGVLPDDEETTPDEAPSAVDIPTLDGQFNDTNPATNPGIDLSVPLEVVPEGTELANDLGGRVTTDSYQPENAPNPWPEVNDKDTTAAATSLNAFLAPGTFSDQEILAFVANPAGLGQVLRSPANTLRGHQVGVRVLSASKPLDNAWCAKTGLITFASGPCVSLLVSISVDNVETYSAMQFLMTGSTGRWQVAHDDMCLLASRATGQSPACAGMPA